MANEWKICPRCQARLRDKHYWPHIQQERHVVSRKLAATTAKLLAVSGLPWHDELEDLLRAWAALEGPYEAGQTAAGAEVSHSTIRELERLHHELVEHRNVAQLVTAGELGPATAAKRMLKTYRRRNEKQLTWHVTVEAAWLHEDQPDVALEHCYAALGCRPAAAAVRAATVATWAAQRYAEWLRYSRRATSEQRRLELRTLLAEHATYRPELAGYDLAWAEAWRERCWPLLSGRELRRAFVATVCARKCFGCGQQVATSRRRHSTVCGKCAAPMWVGTDYAVAMRYPEVVDEAAHYSLQRMFALTTGTLERAWGRDAWILRAGRVL